MENNKGIIIAVVVIIVSLLGIIVLTGGDTKKLELSDDASVILENAQKESSSVKDNEKKAFVQINVDKYLEYYKGTNLQIVLVARTTCQYCQIAEPIIQNIMYKENIDINYLNTDNFTEEDQTNFVNSDEKFSQGYGTPQLLIVKENEIVDSIDGLTDEAHYREFLKKYGFLK